MPKKVATRSPGFNIIEEYTLDEANITADALKDKGSMVSQNVYPGNVETPSLHCEATTSTGVKTETTMLPKDVTKDLPKVDTHHAPLGDSRTSSPPQCEETGSDTKPQVCAQSSSIEKNNNELKSSTMQLQSALHVETRSEKPTTVLDPGHSDVIAQASQNDIDIKDHIPAKQPVTCPEDSLLLVQYPWKRGLTVKLDHIQRLEIDIWSNKVSSYYVFTKPKEVIPIISDVKGYGLRTRPIKMEPPVVDLNEDKTDQLIDQAHALIDMAKTFVTKPVSHKHPRKRPVKAVKPGKVPKALDLLQDMTVNKMRTFHVETDGSNRPSDSVPTTPKCRKIKCKMCDEIFSSVRDLNLHHKQDHGVVKCLKCDKYFSTQSSLDKHSYSHGELKYNCKLCGKCFPFQSRLDQHMMVHINNKLSCPKKSCDRQFKSIWDLNRHMNSHTKGGWYHCDHCDYKNKDKRNTDSHMRTHSTEEEYRYECDKCGKKMHFSTQYKHHREQGCDV